MLCGISGALVDMNCGRKAAKKIAVFGFNRATRNPSRKMRPTDSTLGVTDACAVAGVRSACTPREIMYAAPAYLTTVKASDDTANKAASPTAAPTAFPKLPRATPATDAK